MKVLIFAEIAPLKSTDPANPGSQQVFKSSS